VRAGNIRYRHDAVGRVISRTKARLSRRPDTWHYTWDAEDRLTAVTVPDDTTWHYTYDPLGRRIAKQHLGTDGKLLAETLFTWDGTVLAEQSATIPGGYGDNGSGAQRITTWDYQPGTFTPVTQTEGTSLRDATQQEIDQRFYAIITDLVGTPAEMLAPDGTLAGYQQHTLWGGTTWGSDGASTPLRFPGQYEDPETGLHYNNQRYYDPVTGSYLSPDPLGLVPAPNPYAYVPNPHVLTDPLGLASRGGADELFRNTMPQTLSQELQVAEALKVKPVAVGSPEFDAIINEGQIKWAVLQDGSLVAIPHTVNGTEISHAVLSGGAPVQGAGEANIAGSAESGYYGLDFHGRSGHFHTNETPEKYQRSYQIGKEKFCAQGINFL
jgi:RHS repeat-associated protein